MTTLLSYHLRQPFKIEPARVGPVDIEPGPIEFTPVPRLRKRRNGWSEEVQCAFIEALSMCGAVAAAARSSP